MEVAPIRSCDAECDIAPLTATAGEIVQLADDDVPGRSRKVRLRDRLVRLLKLR